MLPAWRSLIERLHSAPWQGVIAVTGGGASAIADLLTVPGGSQTVLEAVVPYAPQALADWLGKRPEQFCVEETALMMAAIAYQRATHLAGETADPSPVGVGCTASLVSNRPKRGEHRCFVATQTAGATSIHSLILDKGARDRDTEESLVGHLLLLSLSQAAALGQLPSLELRAGEAVVEHLQIADPLLADLFHARRGVVWSHANGSLSSDMSNPPRGVLCGAFNPLHDGHRLLRSVAEKLLGGPVAYEMSIHNVDKPPLDYLTISRRRGQFIEQPIALTNAPTFAAKTEVMPGTTFVVGVDTAERIVLPRYYNGREESMRAALNRIRERGCRFLVAGRTVDDRFMNLADIHMPAEFADLFAAIPDELFRIDISSTDLRRQNQVAET